MKVLKLLLLLFTSSIMYAQPQLNDCAGLAVEGGFFNSAWKAAWGRWSVDNDGVVTIDDYFEEFKNSSHRIRQASSGNVSSITVENIPYVPIGKTYAIQLGNTQPGSQFERLETSFRVDSSSSLIQVHFAVILQDPGHDAIEQPKFEFKALDGNGNTLPCGDYQVIAGGNIPGFKSQGNRIFRNWTTASIDLRAYIGQIITLQFSTYDCANNGHYGMALFAIECLKAEVKTVGLYCPGVDTQITLEAPAGFRDYRWSNGLTDSIVTLQNPQPGDKLWVKFKPFSNLSDNCELTLEYNIPSNNDLIMEDSVRFCEGNQVEVTANGPSGSVYQWANGNTGATLQVNESGVYAVSVTKGNCVMQDSVSANKIERPKGVLNAVMPTCYGSSDGSVCYALTNNSPEISYQWSNNGAEQCIEGVTAGMYIVTVTEGIIGCTSTEGYMLSQPTQLQVDAQLKKTPGCSNTTDGLIAAEANGGTMPYAYLWSTGGTQAQSVISAEGLYRITLTDANECLAEDSIEVKVPKLKIDIQDVGCYKTNSGYINTIAEGGLPPYAYSIQNKPFSDVSNFDSLFAGNYTVRVMDASGCIVSTPAMVKETRSSHYEVSLLADTTIVTLGEQVLLWAEPNYFTNASNILWKAEFDLSCLDCYETQGVPLFPGMVRVWAEDTIGCIAEDSIYLRVLKPLIYYAPNVFKPGDAQHPENASFMVFFKVAQVQEVKKFIVFDRWGDTVFEKRNFMPNISEAAWDGTIAGKEVPADVYTWLVEVLFIDGHTEIFGGDVTLIR